mmetsp:Transcript_3806/g.5317  ORF Transcript_3806/g.5317 Transcript_3806/m.5317 type:complete len:280 (+) Transcript_3806:104-943(+)
MDTEEINKKVLYRPTIAYPTIFLFFFALVIWIESIHQGPFFAGRLPLLICIILSTIASFIMFTVLHDGVHRSISKIRWINETVGRIAALFLSPLASFPAFRYVHLQHHKFTNVKGKDPDLYSGTASWYELPFRWSTQEIAYWNDYLANLKHHSIVDVVETLATLLVMWAVIAFYYLHGEFRLVFWHYLLPCRLSIILLAFSFDYLPHSPHTISITQDRYKTTTLLLFPLQKLFTWLMLYQDYHIIHHLFPMIPFYRYTEVWKLKEHELKSKNVPIRRVF